MPKKIAYVGDFRFPHGAASSVRVLGIARILSDCGYEVSFHGIVPHTELSGNANGKFENYYYSNLVLKSGNILRTAYNLLSSGFRSLKLFSSLKPNYIILGGGYSRYLIPLLIYARKHNIKIIVDIWEWYDYSHLPGGKFGPLALDTHLALTVLIKKCDGIIAISSFLEKYYLSFNLKVARIPILIDKEIINDKDEKNGSFDPNHLHLIYAGIPGKKDLIEIALSGLKCLLIDGFEVKLHLVGPSKDYMTRLLGNKSSILENLDESIIFHGKVAQDKVPSLLANADFSILIRPNMRYANAGFPTKFVESMNASLPIICNITSDLGLYLRDGENGFIMMDDSVESFVQCVKRAYFLSKEEKMQMKLAAKQVAHKSFDYRNFINPIKDFFISIDH